LIFSLIFRLIAGIPPEGKTWIEVGLSLSYQTKNPGKFRLKIGGILATSTVRTRTV
jgi:hypothetical protein